MQLVGAALEQQLEEQLEEQSLETPPPPRRSEDSTGAVGVQLLLDCEM